jgi:hypothetical protein
MELATSFVISIGSAYGLPPLLPHQHKYKWSNTHKLSVSSPPSSCTGFCMELATSSVISIGSAYGLPLSTTPPCTHKASSHVVHKDIPA